MATYTVRTHAGESLDITADSIPEAVRKLQQLRPGVTVLSITPTSVQRAQDQQA